MLYERFIEEYKKNPAPFKFNFAQDIIDKRAKETPERLAMIWLNDRGLERRFTYEFFSEESNRYANTFRAYGIERGDVVLVMLPRRPEWWVIVLALMKLGAIALPVSVQVQDRDLVYRCALAKVKAVVTEKNLIGNFETVRSEINSKLFFSVDGFLPGWHDLGPEILKADTVLLNPAETTTADPMILYFTSGTSGYAKMVRHDYLYSFGHLGTAELWHKETENCIQWTITDTGWAKLCWGSFIAQWMVGSVIFIYDYYAGQFAGKDVLRILEKYGITNFCAPPTVYRMMMQDKEKKYDLSKLRYATCAGEAMGEKDIKRWYEFSGIKLYEGYGQTETTLLLANMPDFGQHPGSLGRPLPGVDVEIVDDDGKLLPTGEQGNIAVDISGAWPPGVFRGYLNEKELNDLVFHHGWYFTRDLGVKDEDGFIWFKGRSDDVFKSSDHRISPYEVEKVVLEHEAVADCIVIGVPDKLRGSVAKAFIQLKDGYEGSFLLMKDIQSFVRKRTTSYMYPRRIEFVTDLPKTINGKKRSEELRRRERQNV